MRGIQKEITVQNNTSNVLDKMAEKKKHILALVNEETEVEAVMKLASALARLKMGRISAVDFVVLPHLTPLSAGIEFASAPMNRLRKAGRYRSPDLPVDSILLLSHDRIKSVANVVVEKNIDLVAGGLKGCSELFGNLRKMLSRLPIDFVLVRPSLEKNSAGNGRLLLALKVYSVCEKELDTAFELAAVFRKKLTVLHALTGRKESDLEERLKICLRKTRDSIPFEVMKSQRRSFSADLIREAEEGTCLMLTARKYTKLSQVLRERKKIRWIENLLRKTEASSFIVGISP